MRAWHTVDASHVGCYHTCLSIEHDGDGTLVLQLNSYGNRFCTGITGISIVRILYVPTTIGTNLKLIGSNIHASKLGCIMYAVY